MTGPALEFQTQVNITLSECLKERYHQHQPCIGQHNLKLGLVL